MDNFFFFTDVHFLDHCFNVSLQGLQPWSTNLTVDFRIPVSSMVTLVMQSRGISCMLSDFGHYQVVQPLLRSVNLVSHSRDNVRADYFDATCMQGNAVWHFRANFVSLPESLDLSSFHAFDLLACLVGNRSTLLTLPPAVAALSALQPTVPYDSYKTFRLHRLNDFHVPLSFPTYPGHPAYPSLSQEHASHYHQPTELVGLFRVYWPGLYERVSPTLVFLYKCLISGVSTFLVGLNDDVKFQIRCYIVRLIIPALREYLGSISFVIEGKEFISV
jgi:hypothetical protein